MQSLKQFAWQEVFPGYVLNLRQRIDVLCAQLFLQVLIDLFETLQAFSIWSEDVHMVWT